jgi:hypothetical protein
MRSGFGQKEDCNGFSVLAPDPGLRIVHADAGGIDVANQGHYV